MKNFYYLRGLLIAVLFFFTSKSEANWLNTQQLKSSRHTPITPYTANTQSSKRDSLPSGVTEDWLNSLKNENGDPIISSRTPGAPEDEGDAMQRKIFNGFDAGSRFGNSVGSAGDVNGDGYSDVILGAPGYSSNTGRAYIYFGGLIMNAVPDVIMTGEAGSFFGWSASSAGDVNADGYSDVIVGALQYSSNTGRAYIFLGELQ